MAYKIPLIKRSWEVMNVIAYLMDDITAELPQFDVRVVLYNSLFRSRPMLQDVQRPKGYVDLML